MILLIVFFIHSPRRIAIIVKYIFTSCHSSYHLIMLWHLLFIRANPYSTYSKKHILNPLPPFAHRTYEKTHKSNPSPSVLTYFLDGPLLTWDNNIDQSVLYWILVDAKMDLTSFAKMINYFYIMLDYSWLVAYPIQVYTIYKMFSIEYHIKLMLAFFFTIRVSTRETGESSRWWCGSRWRRTCLGWVAPWCKNQ